jgi:hypothetical protein
MRLFVLPVVQAAVKVKNAADFPKLVEGLKRLIKSDPLTRVLLPGLLRQVNTLSLVLEKVTLKSA